MSHAKHELSPTIVDVSALIGSPGATRPVQLDVPVPEGFEVPLTSFVGPAEEQVHVDGVLESLVEGVLLRGSVAAEVAQQCALCLEDLPPREVRVDVDELFEEVSQTAERDDVEPGYTITDERIDIDAMIRDALAQAIPDAPRCTEGCKGLCPSCGTNLNSGTCGCDDTVVDARWAALSDLEINP